MAPTARRSTLPRAAAAALGALALLLLTAERADAGKYSVAQCGWRVGSDAEWSDNAGAGKFRRDSYCVTPAGGDPFDAAHLKSFTLPQGGAVSGERLARWRWVAPPGAGITNVRGTWWHVLHDGFRHRLGSAGQTGDFTAFAEASETDASPGAFAAGFDTPRRSFESRLLCARREDRHCDLDPASFTSVRALTLTLSDPSDPRPHLGGSLLAPGWRRGVREASVEATDRGSGVRFTETVIDGARATLAEFSCAKESIGGEWRGTRMAPCGLERKASAPFDTSRLGDGPHTIRACAEDFSGSRGCTEPREILTDNTAPGPPRELALSGGDGWRRSNGFTATWVNPEQGRAAPITAAGYRITGPQGFDSGPLRHDGGDPARLPPLRVPGPGAYSLAVWLRDAAGNEAPAAAARLPLLFDDVAPAVRFLGAGRRPARGRALSAVRAGRVDGAVTVAAGVSDRLSGVASGSIAFRRAGSEHWSEIPVRARRHRGRGHRGRGHGSQNGPARRSKDGPGHLELVARFPAQRLRPGRYELRAVALDVAGNRAATTRRADGSRMVVRVARVRPRVLLRVSPRLLRNGQAVSLRGRVLGGSGHARGPNGTPPRGKLVAVQYLETARRRWRPVLITHTGAGGRFRARYRFRYVTGVSRIRLRALAPAERGWPYSASASPPVVVTVRG